MRNQALRLWFVFGARLRLALAVCCLSSSVPYDISFLPFPSNEQAYEFRGVCFRISRNRAHSYLYLGIQVILLCFIGDALDSSKTVEKSDEIMFRHILLTAWALKGIASMP